MINSNRNKRNGFLIVLVFHSIFKNDNERNMGLIDPSLGITIDEFHSVVEFFINKGITFISYADLQNGLDKNKKYGMITFDDGYYNNTLILPVLKKFGTPGLFFISTNFISCKKCFWWDVIYRERKKKGISLNEIGQEIEQLKNQNNSKIYEYLRTKFGQNSYNCICEIDRPFSSSELALFSKERLVHIGNHTCDHVALARYSPQEIRYQIQAAQNTLKEIVGYTPNTISYPFGKISLSKDVVRITKDIGIKFIFTGYGKNKIPFKIKKDILWITRNRINPNENLEQQYNQIISDSVIYLGKKIFVNRFGYWSFS